jgi:hypothetical protein
MTQARVAAVALAVLLAVVGIGVALSRGGDATNALATTTTTTAPAPQQAGSSTTAASAPNQTRRPAPGTYRYHYERTGSSPQSYDAALVIAHTSAGYTESRDRQSVKVVRIFATTPDGVHDNGFRLDSGSGRATCAWDHPFMMLPRDPKPQQRWTGQAACTLKVGGTASTVRIDSTSTVVKLVDSKVGDATVPLVRIDRKVTLRTTVNKQTATRTSTFTDYYDTTRGLLAQSTEDATETGPSGTTTYRIVETMLTVQPEVSR